MVHGGPWARDTWGLDPQAQWLANRGYLVVQVNFRGSTGYGKSFVSAGDREWGAKMHDDLLDAVNVVVNDGFADKDRIAIFGGSYGGYAALVGAAFTPDVFACAVDIVGPSNLKTLIESIPPYWAPMISPVPHPGGQPRDRARVHVGAVTAVEGRRHPHPPAHRPGGQRPPGQAGGGGADRGRPHQARHRPRVHALPRRGPRLRQAREPAQVLRRRRALPGQAPRGTLRARGRRATSGDEA